VTVLCCRIMPVTEKRNNHQNAIFHGQNICNSDPLVRLHRVATFEVLAEGRTKQRILRNPRWSKLRTTLGPMNPVAPLTRLRASGPTMKSLHSASFICPAIPGRRRPSYDAIQPGSAVRQHDRTNSPKGGWGTHFLGEGGSVGHPPKMGKFGIGVPTERPSR
jgi:hypothetical protein